MRLIQKEFLMRSILVTMQYCMSLTFVFYSFTLFRIYFMNRFVHTNINSAIIPIELQVFILTKGTVESASAHLIDEMRLAIFLPHFALLCARILREISLA